MGDEDQTVILCFIVFCCLPLVAGWFAGIYFYFKAYNDVFQGSCHAFLGHVVKPYWMVVFQLGLGFIIDLVVVNLLPIKKFMKRLLIKFYNRLCGKNKKNGDGQKDAVTTIPPNKSSAHDGESGKSNIYDIEEKESINPLFAFSDNMKAKIKKNQEVQTIEQKTKKESKGSAFIFVTEVVYYFMKAAYCIFYIYKAVFMIGKSKNVYFYDTQKINEMLSAQQKGWQLQSNNASLIQDESSLLPFNSTTDLLYDITWVIGDKSSTSWRKYEYIGATIFNGAVISYFINGGVFVGSFFGEVFDSDRVQQEGTVVDESDASVYRVCSMVVKGVAGMIMMIVTVIGTISASSLFDKILRFDIGYSSLSSITRNLEIDVLNFLLMFYSSVHSVRPVYHYTHHSIVLDLHTPSHSYLHQHLCVGCCQLRCCNSWCRERL
jgi:hypothetical protein